MLALAGQLLSRMQFESLAPSFAPPTLVPERLNQAKYLVCFTTATPYLLEPHKYECGISALMFALGTSEQLLGLDLEKWTVVYLSQTRGLYNLNIRFSELNNVLEQCTGGGKAVVLKKTELTIICAFLLHEVLPSNRRLQTHG